jgi:hypothetical protein
MNKSPKERLKQYREMLDGKDCLTAEHLRIIIDTLLQPEFDPPHFMADNVRDKILELDEECERG